MLAGHGAQGLPRLQCRRPSRRSATAPAHAAAQRRAPRERACGTHPDHQPLVAPGEPLRPADDAARAPAESGNAAAASRRGVLGTCAAAVVGGALTVSAGPARAVQTVVLRDGTRVEAYEHGMTLSIVALRGSVPTQWVLDFRQSLGRYAGFELGQRGQLLEIFQELKDPKAKRSAGAADIVTLGDAWLGAAIKQQLIQPMPSAETYRWWRRLPRRWQQLVRRAPDGRPSDHGDIWACPYRWGATLVAYKRDPLTRRGGRPVRDWDDLLQPQLRGKIAFPESSREFVGIALKTLGAGGGGSGGRGGADGAVGGGGASQGARGGGLGFNSGAEDLSAAGVSREAARSRVRALLRQARAFSDRDHVRTLMAGDTWAVVGTSEDLVPLAERTPSLELVAPASGTALWADLWAVPAHASGGHLKVGPSPILPSWLEFGVMPARASSLGSLRTGATPLLLPNAPPPPSPPGPGPAPREAAPSRGRGLLWWRGDRGKEQQRHQQEQQQQEDHSHRRSHHSHHSHPQQQLLPFDPEAAVLGGNRGYLPGDAVLQRSEFLLPLSDDQLELYSWLLGREEGGLA